MQPTLATLIGIFKASNTPAVCKKDGNIDESGSEKQQGEENCSESSVDSDSVYTAHIKPINLSA